MTHPILYDSTTDGTDRSIRWLLVAVAILAFVAAATQGVLVGDRLDLRNESGPRRASLSGCVLFEEQ